MIDNWKFLLFDLYYCSAGNDRHGSQNPTCRSHILKVAKEVREANSLRCKKAKKTRFLAGLFNLIFHLSKLKRPSLSWICHPNNVIIINIVYHV